MTNPTPEQLNKQLAEKVAKKLGCNELDIDFIAFSWPTVGLAIEDAREKGWYIHMGKNRAFFEKPNILRETTPHKKVFSLSTHGDIKAILLAYAEIPDE